MSQAACHLQIFPTIDSLPASGLTPLTPRLYDWSVSFEHLGFLFLVFFITLFVWFRAAD